MNKVSAPLIAFAYLAETAHESGHSLDLISALAPLLNVIASDHEDELFNPVTLSNELRQRFGLRVNPYAVEQWIPKLCAAGVIRVKSLADAKNGKNVQQIFFAKQTSAVDRFDESDIDALIESFKAFAKPKLAGIGRHVSDSELEEFFLRELADLDFLAAVLRTNK